MLQHLPVIAAVVGFHMGVGVGQNLQAVPQYGHAHTGTVAGGVAQFPLFSFIALIGRGHLIRGHTGGGGHTAAVQIRIGGGQHAQHRAEKNASKSYLRPQASEKDGTFTITTFYRGKPIDAHTLRFTASDGSYVELQPTAKPYVMSDATGRTERTDFAASPDVAHFVVQHANIKVTVIGENGKAQIPFTKADAQALVQVADLAIALQASTTLQAQQQEMYERMMAMQNENQQNLSQSHAEQQNQMMQMMQMMMSGMTQMGQNNMINQQQRYDDVARMKDEYRENMMHQQQRIDNTQDRSLNYTTERSMVNAMVQNSNNMQFADTKWCGNCGAKIPSDAHICSQCGAEQ